jgi:hypothetical protein
MSDHHRAAALALGALLASVLVSTTASPAGAGVLPLLVEVTTTDDVVADGQPVSLREAVATANGHSGPVTIALQSDQTYQLDLCGTPSDSDLGNESGDLDHTVAQTLRVDGAGSTVQQTCAGQRVFEHTAAGGLLDLADVRITGGSPSGAGGGVRSEGGLVLDGVVLEGNTSGGLGGGASATVGLGVDASLVQDNTAQRGGGLSGGDVDITASTITENLAHDLGGGVYSPAHQTLLNTTVSRNRAFEGGGIWSGDGVSLTHSTVVANYGGGGAANVHNDEGMLAGRMSVIALGSVGNDCASPEGVTDAGHNVSGDDTCFIGPSSTVGRHPMLGQMGDNGGPTPTYRPVVGSPTLDRDAAPCDLTTDQRGQPRPELGGTACDAGSVEADPPACTQAFPDVGAGHPFFADICWLVQSGITTGFPDGTFKPGAAVTRQSMSAFIYRLALSPVVLLPASPSFDDVGPIHPFRSEIEWLAFEEITTGFPDGTFKPGSPVTRQSMSAFLYRLAGGTISVAAPPVTPTFSDVSAAHPFFEEIEWMAEAGVSEGYSDGTFRPGTAVSRAAMAAFLQRVAADLYLGGI